MAYLLDTNTCIRCLNVAPSPVKQLVQATPIDQVYLCDVVKGELWYGAYRSQRRKENLSLLVRFFSGFISFPFDAPSSQIFGEIRADLARRGTPIGPYDLQIAAAALANDLTLVTHNTSEFSRIRNLKLQDWEV